MRVVAMPATAKMSFGCGHASESAACTRQGSRQRRKFPCSRSAQSPMARIESSSLPNGLPLHRVELPAPAPPPCSSPSTRARAPSAPKRTAWPTSSSTSSSRAARSTTTTARSTRPPRRWARVLNAYTSHDLVAFHITCRAEVVADAIDLLTDFVGRPRIDAEELDRERGVVIQEIARAHDQPSVRRRAPDRPGRVRRPPARPPGAGPRGAPADVQPRRDPRLPRAASGPARAAARSWSATSTTCPRTARWPSCSAASRRSRPTAASEPAPPFAPATLVEERDSNQSHLRMSYRPSIDPRAPAERAALTVYSTLLGGSMGSRLFDEIREQRGLAYSVYALDHTFADVPILQLAAGLDSTKCVEAYARMREIVDELRDRRPDRGGGRARPRLRRRPPRAGVREHQRGRPPRRGADGHLRRRTSTPTRRSRRSTRSPTTRSSRSPAGSPRSSRWPASARTRRTSSHSGPCRVAARPQCVAA